jgi:hypothetical protein
VSTRFCDKQTESTKTICLPQDGGDIILHFGGGTSFEEIKSGHPLFVPQFTLKRFVHIGLDIR